MVIILALILQSSRKPLSWLKDILKHGRSDHVGILMLVDEMSIPVCSAASVSVVAGGADLRLNSAPAQTGNRKTLLEMSSSKR